MARLSFDDAVQERLNDAAAQGARLFAGRIDEIRVDYYGRGMDRSGPYVEALLKVGREHLRIRANEVREILTVTAEELGEQVTEGLLKGLLRSYGGVVDGIANRTEQRIRGALGRCEAEIDLAADSKGAIRRGKNEIQIWAAQHQQTAATPLPVEEDAQARFVSDERIAELRSAEPEDFDLKKLVRLCEELNIAFGSGAYFATAMLTRAILDHVPPVLGLRTFSEVGNNYGATRSFRDAMERLDKAARKIADDYLHGPIRSRETLPTAQQVNFAAEVDMLLGEITRIL